MTILHLQYEVIINDEQLHISYTAING